MHDSPVFKIEKSKNLIYINKCIFIIYILLYIFFFCKPMRESKPFSYFLASVTYLYDYAYYILLCKIIKII